MTPAPEHPDPPHDQAGPMVRPFVMAGGRSRPVRGGFDLITQVMATRPAPAAELGLGPEHLAIMRLCRDAMSVAEITGRLDLPAGTVRVLLGDLLDRGHVIVQEPRPEAEVTDIRIYEAVLNGLRAL
ncbi:DUF742 domain-containing protein [Thermomonospora umbrina]|uniref:Uncharacterized protein DUF742 n=1 Tax=Thermomonospora umbrina TaxID=111806 RepID=A0A3D9SXB9_9ACTN|nr:DUF742 domain-containing protein [Thermomonospora umbrina]REE98693.1 uncharacterized protein DUF742 [Thermomonospora umbrina]